LLFANLLQMPIACVDGWHSPSIGARGACSYHGGVGHGSMLWFLISIAAGLGAWGFAEWNSPRRQFEEESDRLRKLAEAEATEQKRLVFKANQAADRERAVETQFRHGDGFAPASPAAITSQRGSADISLKRCDKCGGEMRAVISAERSAPGPVALGMPRVELRRHTKRPRRR